MSELDATMQSTILDDWKVVVVLRLPLKLADLLPLLEAVEKAMPGCNIKQVGVWLVFKRTQ